MIQTAPLVVQVVALALCLWAESFFPLFMDRKGKLRLIHIVRNATIGLVNGVVLTLGFSGLTLLAIRWGELHQIGLLQQLSLAPGTEQVIGFLAFDLWMYLWHRANHTVPFLWRFHRMHHSDPAVDTTSALRFHIGEMVISSILRLAVIPLLGIPFKDLVSYELVLQPVILFHHSNIALPETLDRWMRLFVVSPNMHRVHHSDIPVETNSNYASIFSVWDRIWGSYQKRDTATIRYGLKEFRDPVWQTLKGMLIQPTV